MTMTYKNTSDIAFDDDNDDINTSDMAALLAGAMKKNIYVWCWRWQWWHLEIPLISLLMMTMRMMTIIVETTSDMAALLVGAMKDSAAIWTPTDAVAGWFDQDYWILGIGYYLRASNIKYWISDIEHQQKLLRKLDIRYWIIKPILHLLPLKIICTKNFNLSFSQISPGFENPQRANVVIATALGDKAA